MNKKYENLINEIKKMIKHEDGIYNIKLINKPRDPAYADAKPISLSGDSCRINVFLYKEDTLEEMADKLLKAESMMDIALENIRYRRAAPNLIEALIYNIPELT